MLINREREAACDGQPKSFIDGDDGLLDIYVGRPGITRSDKGADFPREFITRLEDNR